jgi:hypothetical protein
MVRALLAFGLWRRLGCQQLSFLLPTYSSKPEGDVMDSTKHRPSLFMIDFHGEA